MKYKTTIRKENGNVVKKKYFIGLKLNSNTNLKTPTYNYDKATAFLESIANESIENNDNHVEDDTDSFFRGFGLKSE